MFSVAASPFNSAPRATYGGAICRPKRITGGYFPSQTNDPYLKKLYWDMVSKFSTNPTEKRFARQWIKQFKSIQRDNPQVRSYMRRAARNFADGTIRQAMAPINKNTILQLFRRMPVPTPQNRDDRWLIQFLKKAPYPSWPVMNALAYAGVPYQDNDPNVPIPNMGQVAATLRNWGDVWRAARAARIGRMPRARRDAIRQHIQAMVNAVNLGLPVQGAPPAPAGAPAAAPLAQVAAAVAAARPGARRRNAIVVSSGSGDEASDVDESLYDSGFSTGISSASSTNSFKMSDDDDDEDF